MRKNIIYFFNIKSKKIKLHKGLRHYFGLKVRGQHTNSTGRRGKTVGVSRTKA